MAIKKHVFLLIINFIFCTISSKNNLELIVMATFERLYHFSIPQRVIFTSFQSPVPRIHLFRAHPSLFFRPPGLKFAFTSRNMQMLDSHQLLIKIFLASLQNNYGFANRSYPYASQFNANMSQAKSPKNHEAPYSEKAQPARPMSAEESANAAVQARAFKLLNIPIQSQSSLPSDYATLGVQEGAAKASIKKAYHSLSLKFHPDKYRGSDQPAATEAFRLVSEAYARLTN